MNNRLWKFRPSVNSDLYSTYCKEGELNQENLPNAIGNSPLASCLISWGSIERAQDKGDNSLQPSIDMKDYFVMTVNGMKGMVTNVYDTVLQAQYPVSVYTGSGSGAPLSPTDDKTIHYIVISGSIMMAPIAEISGNFNSGFEKSDNQFVEFEDGSRWYSRRWYDTQYPCGPVSPSSSQSKGLTPPEEGGKKLCEFTYSAIGDSADHISKVGVLACMLIVGDKCLVETGTQGRPSDFEWRSYKSRPQCSSDDEYYEQTFTIGIDPKTGDKLIGTEFDIQNNITPDLGIDARGMAIPVRHSDAISGEVKFIILGPVNMYWDEVTFRHRTWFRSAKWTSNSIAMLEKISNIYIREFEIQVVSDNSLNESLEECDLVYISDTDEKYFNKKDDITFRISSALTSEERAELGVKDKLSLSTALSGSSSEGLLEIYDNMRTQGGKPEQLYVDSAWQEWHEPRVIMTQRIDDMPGSTNRFDRYSHRALPGKEFFTQGISRHLLEGEAVLNLKEIDT